MISNVSHFGMSGYSKRISRFAESMNFDDAHKPDIYHVDGQQKEDHEIEEMRKKRSAWMSIIETKEHYMQKRLYVWTKPVVKSCADDSKLSFAGYVDDTYSRMLDGSSHLFSVECDTEENAYNECFDFCKRHLK